MHDLNPELHRVHRELGYKRLNRPWAKIEIVLGLGAAGIGLCLASHAPVLETMAFGVILFVLGGYLTLAGHRSHLYQSNTELAAFFLRELDRLTEGRASGGTVETNLLTDLQRL